VKQQRDYSWRHAKAVGTGLVRAASRNELWGKLLAIGPRAVYGGALDFALRSRSEKPAGYAAHLFKDAFGTWPRPCDRGPPAPLPDFLIEEWAATRTKRNRVIIKAEKPAPLLDRVAEKPPLELDADGYVKGTLMKPTKDDFWFEWK
jgi:hypothetical protein